MKLSRDSLKSLIKECLVEILAEGLGETITEGRKPLVGQRRSTNVPRRIERPRTPIIRNDSINETINEISKNNSFMKELLEDTARNTLPTLLEGDSPTYVPQQGKSVIDQVVAQTSPEDLFGEEVTDKWASLAFNTAQPVRSEIPKHTTLLQQMELDRPVK